MVILTLLLAAAGLTSVFRSIVKPFWFDELCTVIVSDLPTVGDVQAALDNVADASPLGYVLAVRVANHLVPDNHLGHRLPSVLGVVTAIACMYFFLSRRVSRLAALAGAAFLLCTLLPVYAPEARPYGLLLGCISAAMLAWQRADDGWGARIALALTFTAAGAVHYYAVLVWPAFYVAEATVWLTTRRFRGWVWGAFLTGFIPFAIFAGRAANAKRYYGQTFWARATPARIFSAQDSLFGGNDHWGLTIVTGLTLTLAVVWLAGRAGWTPTVLPRRERWSIPAQDVALTLMLLLLPVTSVALALVMNGAMIARYMLATVLGGALAAGFLADQAPGLARAMLLGLFCANYAFSFSGELKTALSSSLLGQRTAQTRRMEALTELAPEPDLPVVVACGLDYLPLMYYTPASERRRLFTLIDREAAVRLTGSDSSDLALLALRKYAPVQLEDYAGFLARNREFLLVTWSGETYDWTKPRLLGEGHSLRLLKSVGTFNVYRVTLRDGAR